MICFFEQIGNKVFIQGANQAASCPSKQHIVYRPINTANVSAAINVTNAHLQQKHILLKKSTSSTAQIVPLNTAATNSQPNAPYRKPTFAYFIKSKARNVIEVSGGTIFNSSLLIILHCFIRFKINLVMYHCIMQCVFFPTCCCTFCSINFDVICCFNLILVLWYFEFVVIGWGLFFVAGALPTTQLGKSKSVFVPVISPQAGTAATAPQNSSAKHMTNILVPVLPQPSSPRPSMFNLKINNVPNNNDAKGTITGKQNS